MNFTTYCQIDIEDFVNFCGLLRKREESTFQEPIVFIYRFIPNKSIVKCLVHLYFSADVLCKYVSALLHVRIYCYSVSIFCAIAFMQLEHRAIVVERNEFASVIQDRTGVPSLLKTASFCSFSALLSTL